ncbi:MAG TPA: PQQ-dependent sugar dehydrogenase [Solirubrobacteraceae bacterium]|nr:PQQ-dependent sugar dehydrogenase [Solirubrobacteraceae bacterium]
MTTLRPLLVPLVAGVALLTAVAADSPATSASAKPARAADRTAHAAATVGLRSIGRFSAPVFVTSPPADAARLFVVEQGGKIVVVRNGQRRTFLDVSSKVVSGGEQGLLGLAFAPDYARSRLLYVYYTDRAGDERIVEYRAATADRADSSSARVLITQDDSESNHNGGMLAFGPDKLLYAGLGDGGGGDDQHGARGNGQSLGTLLGKIIRIDPRPSQGRAYTIPASNPFVGRAGARGEIYAYGLRNPWRFSFDRATGSLTIADVGQEQVEEIDFAVRGGARGKNYGWRVWEGRRRHNTGEQAPGAVFPVLTKTHAEGYCSITGGYVVRDPSLPALRGQYVYGDFCKSGVRAVRLRSGGASGDRQLTDAVSKVSSFGEDAAGHVYVVSLDGPVYRLVAGG